MKPPLLFVLAVILLMTGCTRTAPVSYYQLSSIEDAHAATDGSVIGDSVFGIGPVRLPQYLDRPQMLIRQGVNQLQLSEGHRWVEPLAENIPRVLRENLSVLLHTERLLLYPWDRNTSVAYQLVIDLVRFEGEGYGEGQLEAIWLMQNSDGKILLPQQRSSYSVATANPDHEGLATALSEALALLCREIVQELSQNVYNQVD